MLILISINTNIINKWFRKTPILSIFLTETSPPRIHVNTNMILLLTFKVLFKPAFALFDTVSITVNSSSPMSCSVKVGLDHLATLV